MAETSINYLTEDDHAVISTDERKWINRVNELVSSYPGQVEIRSVFKDGTVVAHIPKAWVKVRPPAKRSFTDEQKAAMAERMREVAGMRKGAGMKEEGDVEMGC